MEPNVYEAPKSDLSTEVEQEFDYYTVSKNKFIVLFVATIGMYGIYWFYQNWSLQKKATGSTIWPVMRGIFSIFFAHSLFRNVDASLQAKNHNHEWNHASLATVYVISSVASGISDRLSSANAGSPITEFVGLALLGVTGWVLYRAQIAINIASGDPEGESNAEYTAANIIWIVLGIAFWILVFVGVFALFM